MTISHLNRIFLGLGNYLFTVNVLSRKNRSMRHGMRNLRKLKVRFYAVQMIDLNEYLAAFPGAKSGENIGETELNETILNSIQNVWSR